VKANFARFGQIAFGFAQARLSPGKETLARG
jgi:hypothetical protein